MSTSSVMDAKLSHADSNRLLRESKARAIEARLGSALADLSAIDLLDVGTGSGTIASYFAGRVRSLQSVDVVDERMDHDFSFTQIESERLPFEDESFDAAISNHVIEHTDDQRLHLGEIARVLRPGGVCYLAAPNRYALIEPHFRLPLLSWLPAERRDGYVRMTRRGERYDVQPVTKARLFELARNTGFEVRDLSDEVAREQISRRLHVDAGPMPRLLRCIYPAFVMLLVKHQASDVARSRG